MDRIPWYDLILAFPATGAAAYGLTLEAGGDGRYAVADLTVNGPAERAGFDYGDDVDEVDVERLGQPAKEWVWILAFGLLGLVLLVQGIRWRRRQPPPRKSD